MIGAVPGMSRRRLGASWGGLGRSEAFKAVLGRFGNVLAFPGGLVEAVLRRPRPFRGRLGLSWGVLGRCGAVLGPARGPKCD